MTSDIQIEDYEQSLLDFNSTPEPEETEEEIEVNQCDCFLEYSDITINYKGYIICNECINNQEGENLNEIVEMIEINHKHDMRETMNQINSLCYSVLNPYK
jgi:hypothetical protein